VVSGPGTIPDISDAPPFVPAAHAEPVLELAPRVAHGRLASRSSTLAGIGIATRT
jgi:hypothetical protein